jgi:3-phenylpropionate/trans-cinnamate dioxygenase ferredoxin subunit
VYDGGVECSLHGSTFDLETGAPSSLPATRPVPTFATRVVDGRVEIDVDGATNGAPTPDH